MRLRSSSSSFVVSILRCHQQQQGETAFQTSRTNTSSFHQRWQHIAKRSHSSAIGSEKVAPTLFSLPGLSHPSDFVKLAEQAIHDCNSIRQELATSLNEEDGGNDKRVEKAKRTLHLLDDISNVVCTVIDAAELCRSAHATQQWRNGASDAFGVLSEYIGSLNADESLYRSLIRFVFNDDTSATGSCETLANLPADYQRMAKASEFPYLHRFLISVMLMITSYFSF